MPLTTIYSPPVLDSFTPLSEHQSQTPTTFFGAKPVLHSHITGARVLVPKDQTSKLPLFSPTGERAHEGIERTERSDNLDERTEEDRQSPVTAIVDIFVNSENLTIFNPSRSIGLSIPYPTITLHAISRLSNPDDPSQEIQGLYMQLECEAEPSPSEEDEELETVELTIIPPTAATTSPHPTTSGAIPESIIKTLFEAVSACSNLHPDPASQDDQDMLDGDDEGGNSSRIIFEGNVGYEGISGLPGAQMGTNDGGLPPPFPGSGGWITAENVGEYFDEEGNWIGEEEGDGEQLGEGAGRVRGRDEVDDEDMGKGARAKVNGHCGDDEEHKKPRTE